MISTRIHGILDYIVGIALIAAPWLLGFAHMGAETWVPVILGVGAIVYALMTDFEMGVVPVIPMGIHLGIDVIAGAFLAVSPWLLGYANIVWVPHLIVGLLLIVAGLLTERIPTSTRRTATGV